MGRVRIAGLVGLFVAASVAVAAPMGVAVAAGSVSLTTLGSPYTQDFDTLTSIPDGGTSNAVPDGWDFFESDDNANTTYRVGTGSLTTGDTYSFGATATTERAFGGLLSGTLVPMVGAQFTNDTGATITSFDIAYTGEQWRLGQNTTGRAADRLDFQLSTTATSLGTGTWSDVDDLDFPSPVTSGTVGALNGNVAPNRAAVSRSITGLAIAAGASFWIRWADTDLIPGSDDGLAVDDFSITPSSTPTPSNLSIDDVSMNEGDTGTTSFDFTVSLSQPAGQGGVTFDIATADDTATTASGDYVARALTGQTIPAGSSTYTFSVLVNGDGGAEGERDVRRERHEHLGLRCRRRPGPRHDPERRHPADRGPRRPRCGSRVPVRRSDRPDQRCGDGGAPRQRARLLHPRSESRLGRRDERGRVRVHQLGSGRRRRRRRNVIGAVTEFGSTPNLTITQLTAPTVTVLSSGNPLPAAQLVGPGGRIPPASVIDDDSPTRIDVTTAGSFDAVGDGIDFYESLEGMRVQVNDPTATGPTSNFGSNREIPVVGVGASLRTPTGGIVIRPDDFNPERIILNDWIAGGPTLPDVHVGATFGGATLGVVDYSFGNFKLQVTSLGTLFPSTITREVAEPPDLGELAVATFNVENLDPGDGAAQFDELADLIVDHLGAPDLVALEEVQDNSGPTNNGVVDATVTLNTLTAAITSAGGPTYQFRQINPVDGADGGEPGGNIRQAFLFRTDRGLAFVDRPGGGSTAAVTVVDSAGTPALSASPGRIAPTDPAFTTSRKPLAGEFTYRGQTLFVVANHFNSKGGDEPLFGRFQPPALVTEVQRVRQATIVAGFVDDVRAIDPTAAVLVVGDINDFEFSAPMQVLKGADLSPLIEELDPDERYTYVFQGNAQSLDHILMSPSLMDRPFEFDSRPRQRRVRRPDQRPRPAARAPQVQRRADRRRGRPVRRCRGDAGGGHRDRQRSGWRRAQLRLGPRRQRHVRDARAVGDGDGTAGTDVDHDRGAGD